MNSWETLFLKPNALRPFKVGDVVKVVGGKFARVLRVYPSGSADAADITKDVLAGDVLSRRSAKGAKDE